MPGVVIREREVSELKVEIIFSKFSLNLTYLERGDTTGLKVEREGLGEGDELEEIELTEDFGGGGGAFGLCWTPDVVALLSAFGLGGAGGGMLNLSSSSDTSGDDENIFWCAFLNSAISRSCFSFFSVM